MIMMPVVFALVVLIFALRRSGARTTVQLLAAGGLLAFVVITFLSDTRSSGYFNYASTVQQEGLQRIQKGVLGSFTEAVQQAGIFGYGLGTATQGSRYASHGARTWQEDGFSRLAAELGLIGTTLLLAAMVLAAKTGYRCLKGLAGAGDSDLQVDFVALLAANAASFLISHQAYSGDPSTIAIATMCFGFLLAGSRAANLQARVASGNTASTGIRKPLLCQS